MLYNAWPVIITALLHALLCLPTYSNAQTSRHTHPAPRVSSHILYSIALSPTLSVCSQPATQMSERERRQGRPGVGGVGRLKVKDKERETYKSEVHFGAETSHLHDCTNQ